MRSKCFNLHNTKVISSKIYISSSVLLFLAGIVWAFAGTMLILKAVNGLMDYPQFITLKLLIALPSGITFYLIVFSKISLKNIKRIKSMPDKKGPFYSFLSFRSFIIMSFMISFGISIRKLNLIPFEYLSVFYITMGIPLFFSAIRFFYNGISSRN